MPETSIAEMLGAVFVFLDVLAYGEIGMLQAEIGNGVGPEIRVVGL